MREIIVDNFAGGGGASTEIELATGRSADIAINHDPAAIAMHKENHPTTEHYCESVWEVGPRGAVRGRPVFVIDNPKPFIVRIGQTGFGGDRLQYEIDKPLTTITTKAEHYLVAPFLTSYHSETTKNEVRGLSVDEPIHSLDTSNRFGLDGAFIEKFYKTGIGQQLTKPLNCKVRN
ncbi:MAG: cytosine-specific methylase [Anaerosolibacter sp.]|uniref:hypothetical protein n=1 Tax=Anaerosolibacter sp. TaxID=1872527 RepID=UPI002A3D4362|nr:cytosine-specific methylase [Anaerosolibacter sp.]